MGSGSIQAVQASDSNFNHINSAARLSPFVSGPVCQCLVTLLTVATMAWIVFEFRDSTYHVLLWIERQDTWVTCIMFAGLFTIVSLPLTWGYILLNLACGYLFGILAGILVVVTTAAVGVFVAHMLVKHLCLTFIADRILNSHSLRAFVCVISGPQAFRVVAFARLTPIPFGLQNAIFAVSCSTPSQPYDNIFLDFRISKTVIFRRAPYISASTW